MKTAYRWIFPLVFLLASACSTIERALPQSRTYVVPMARVKPAMVSTLSGMGLRMTALETRGGREVLKARKPGTEVEVELESVSRSSTRVRVSANSGGLTNDTALTDRIYREAGRIIGES